jgi:hypothetical protein
MRISFFIATGGVGLLIFEGSGLSEFITGGGGFFVAGLLLIGLGGIWALFELLADTIDGFLNKAYPPSKSSGIKTILPVKGTFRSHDPETGKARSRWGTWTALLIFGLIAYIISSFLNWLPGPI